MSLEGQTYDPKIQRQAETRDRSWWRAMPPRWRRTVLPHRV